MRSSKLFGVSVMAAALVVSAAGAASAGEVTGNGRPIEVKGASECAFSGLDDVDEGEDPTDPSTDDFGRTQNFGQIRRTGAPVPAGMVGMLCNPTRGFPS